MKKEYKICSRCVMDETDPDIQFDVYGECNNCKRYDERIENDLHYDEEGQKMLNRIITKIEKVEKTGNITALWE